MKKKISFVTNSSSTSFLMGFPDKVGKSRKITITINLEEEEDYNIIDSIEKLDSLMKLNYYDQENYKIAKEIIKNGGEVYNIDSQDLEDNFLSTFNIEYKKYLISKG